MFGNGAKIGMTILKNTKCCVEGLGSTMLTSFMLLPATFLVIGTTTAVSIVCQGQTNSH